MTTKITVRLPWPVNLGEFRRKHGYKPTGKIGLPTRQPRPGCAVCKATGVSLNRDELCKRCRRSKKAKKTT